VHIPVYVRIICVCDVIERVCMWECVGVYKKQKKLRVCTCVCVRERERERECACVCVPCNTKQAIFATDTYENLTDLSNVIRNMIAIMMERRERTINSHQKLVCVYVCAGVCVCACVCVCV